MGNAKNINEIFGRNAVVMSQPDGSWPLASELIGIEIETEDFRGDELATRPEWVTHQDGSLRNGTEFVLASPLGGKQLTAAISKFFNSGYKYNMSERTSVHVHVNASDNMTVDQFRNMFIIMYLIEPAIFRWADENRKWCGYCSPLTDLEPERIAGILAEQDDNNKALYKAVGGGPQRTDRVDPDRYYGFNIKAYARHGTVEFRYFPCTKEEKMVVDWVKFAMCVKRAAVAAPEPQDFLRSLSTRTLLEAFIDNAFPEAGLNQVIRDRLDWDDAAGRVHELLNILLLKVDSIRRAGIYAQRSQGFSKLLSAKFPRVAATAPEIGADAQVKSAAGLLRKYLDDAAAAPAEFDWDNAVAVAASAPVPESVIREYNRQQDRIRQYSRELGEPYETAVRSSRTVVADLERRYPGIRAAAQPATVARTYRASGRAR